MWDSIKSAGRSKVRKETSIQAWRKFADKCEQIIIDWTKRDPKGIPQTMLLIKSDVSLWTFNKYKPLMLQFHPKIFYNKKTKRYIYKNPVT